MKIFMEYFAPWICDRKKRKSFGNSHIFIFIRKFTLNLYFKFINQSSQLSYEIHEDSVLEGSLFRRFATIERVDWNTKVYFISLLR